MPRYARLTVEFVVLDENDEPIARFNDRGKAEQARSEYDAHRNLDGAINSSLSSK